MNDKERESNQTDLLLSWQDKARLRGVEARRKENPGAIEPGELVRLVRDQKRRLNDLRVDAELVNLVRDRRKLSGNLQTFLPDVPGMLATAETKEEVENIAKVLGIDLAEKEDVTAVTMVKGDKVVSLELDTRRGWKRAIAKAASDVAYKYWRPDSCYSWYDLGGAVQSSWVAAVESAITARVTRKIWGGTPMFHAYHSSNGTMFDWDTGTDRCKEGWELAAYVVLSLLGIQEPESFEEAIGKISDGMWKAAGLPQDLLVGNESAGINLQSAEACEVVKERPRVSSLMEFSPSEDPRLLFQEYKNRPKEERRWIESIAEGALAVWVGTGYTWKTTSPKMQTGFIAIVEAAMKMMSSTQCWNAKHVDPPYLRAVYFVIIGNVEHLSKVPWGTSKGVHPDWNRIRDFVAGALIDRFSGPPSMENGGVCASDVKNGDRNRKYELVAHRSDDGKMRWVTEEWMIEDHKYVKEANRDLRRGAKKAEDRADHLEGVVHALEAELNYLTRGDR